MPKPIRYQGKIYASEGELVNSLIKDEARFIQVWIVPDKKYEKMILNFRVVSQDTDTFIDTTFFRAAKHLDKSTLDNIKLFKEIKYNLDQKNFGSFGKFLDQHRIDEERYKNDVVFMTMTDCIKQMRSTEL